MATSSETLEPCDFAINSLAHVFDFLYYLLHFPRVTPAPTVAEAKFSSENQPLSPFLTHLLLCSPAPTVSFWSKLFLLVKPKQGTRMM